MYLAITPQKSCARTWIAACNAILANGDEGYNIIMDIGDPFNHDDRDNQVITLVDKFLRKHKDVNPIITVANTIFPQSLLDKHGPSKFYDVYHRDFAKFSKTSKLWGRYFERMTRQIDQKGNTINPLQDLIDKLKAKEAKGTRKGAAYELAITPAGLLRRCDASGVDEDHEITIYRPSRDRKMPVGGPCLSYLSFKRHPREGLLLTAMYRNHYYITRLLGNLIGLGRLQKFVATQAGVSLGSLTVISTHAELDTGKWGIVRARDLVKQASGILQKK